MIYLHGRIWWVRFQHNSIEYRRSSRSTVREDAERFEVECREDIRREHAANDTRTAITELLDRAIDLHRRDPDKSAVDFLTRAEVAKRFGVSENWVRRNGPPPIPMFKRPIRYSAWVAEMWLLLLREIPRKGDVDLSWLSHSPAKPEDGFVYFVQVGGDGPVKIGWTSELRKRLHSLQTSTPYGLNTIAVICGAKSVEGQFHETFRKYRGRGEWFEPGWRVRSGLCQPAFLRLMLPFYRGV